MPTVDLQQRETVAPLDFAGQAAAVLEHAPDGMLLTVLDGRVLASNAAARTLLGRTDAEIRAAGRAEIAVMKSVKKALDPQNILNPGKILDP